jgi:hypothetical protein
MFGIFSKRESSAPVSDKHWSGRIANGPDCPGKRKDLNGRCLRFPTGEVIAQDNSGGLIVRNRSGNICKTVSRQGAETHFDYDFNNRLVRVSLHSGNAYVCAEDGIWSELRAGKECVRTELEFRLLTDGTLRVSAISQTGKPHCQDYRLDGSSIKINEKGRTTAISADLDVQRQRLYTILDNMQREHLILGDQRQALCDALHSLHRRVALDEITETEAAKTLYHIAQLLESGGHSPLGAQQCFLLAHELVFFAACPDFADNSDALSCLIAELFRRHPSHAAMLVADMSVHKRYVTSGGWTIKYVEELMNPHVRRKSEWASMVESRRFIESNRFLRVVLVNIVERLRLADRASNVALLDERRRMFSTREFGRVFERDLGRLWQQMTGLQCDLDFNSFRKVRTDLEDDDRKVERLSQSGSQLPRALA